MKPSQHIRISLAVAALTAMAASSRAQTTLIGPGVVPTPVIITDSVIYSVDARIVSGTEIIATTASVIGGSSLRGIPAVSLVYGGNLIVDDGIVRGASVASQAGITSFWGGAAIAAGTPNLARLEIFDGDFRGGSISLAATGPFTFPGPAVHGSGQDGFLDVVIHDGYFEGGVVTVDAAPGTIVARAPALHLASEYGGHADIRGGEFVGGITVEQFPTQLRIRGSNFSVNPRPTGRFERANFVVTGNYDDGTPFSTPFRYNVRKSLVIVEGPGTLDIVETIFPEPAAGSMAAWWVVGICGARRRLRMRA
jgi:hypothetical protein